MYRFNMTASLPNSTGLGPLQFPISQNKLFTKIRFQAIKVNPPEVRVTDFKASDTGDGGSGGSSSASASSVSKLSFTPLADEKIDIHVPLSFQVNDGMNYAGTELGSFGGAITGALNNAQSIGSAAMAGLTDMGKSFGDLFSLFGGSEQELGRLAASRLARRLPAGLGGNAVQVAARVSINPNIRAQFQNVNIREFNFAFKFIPTSEEESAQIKKIIKMLRFHAYPEEIPSGSDFSIGYEYPSMFKIRLIAGSKNIGTPIKLAYLKTVSTTYNPTATSVFYDGSPTEIDMNLTFMEYKALSRRDVWYEEDDNYYDLEGVSETTSTPPTDQSGSDEFAGNDQI